MRLMSWPSGSQTFLKKLRNGPLAIFQMAHGTLVKLIQINTLVFYGINVMGAIASLLPVRLCLVQLWTTQPSCHESHPIDFELSA